ncbi:pseudouridine synthase [Lipomyces oligophaga]|uniref:pseudouridine synthase n=1 Tax=Lipomyces oligophaga TaxID=45792 RepID=UPI0034CDE012
MPTSDEPNCSELVAGHDVSIQTNHSGRQAKKRGRNQHGKEDVRYHESGRENKKPRAKFDRKPWGPKPKVFDQEGNEILPEPRRPKRKVACLIGYCGTGYYGMQFNPPLRTIEGDIFNAMVKAGAISKDNANDPKKVRFLRSARTDKGVHAAGNVISVKLIIEDDDILEKINANLPDTIRIWGISRVTGGFDCRKHCGSRVYEYLIPSYAFISPRPQSPFGLRLREMNSLYPGVMRADPEGEQFWKSIDERLAAKSIDVNQVINAFEKTRATDKTKSAEEIQIPGEGKDDAKPTGLTEVDWQAYKTLREIELDERLKYRITPERLGLVRQAMKIYEGSHNFHNFTLKKSFTDPSAKRFMKNITVSDPKLIDNTEWLSIKIHGQSFMLHQIRKMIFMAAETVRAGTPIDHIMDAFLKTRVSIPKAPALGLLLERPVFDDINNRLTSYGHSEIDFKPFDSQIEIFKQNHIYDKIFDIEMKEHTFHSFFNYLDMFNGATFLDFFTAKYARENGMQEIVQTSFEDEEDREELDAQASDREG